MSNFDIFGLAQVVLAVIAIAVDVAIYARDHFVKENVNDGNMSKASAKAFKKHLIKGGVLALSVALLISGIVTFCCLDNSGVIYGNGSVTVSVDGADITYEDALVYNNYVQLDLPEKAGYELTGVVDERTGEPLFDENGKSKSPVQNRDLSDFDDCKLKAVYEPVKYSLSVKSATGAVACAAMYTVEDNPSDLIDEPSPLDGYVFTGWYTDSKFKKPFTGNFSDYIDMDEPLVLYPCYELQRWSISWDVCGGEFTTAPVQTFDLLTDIALPDSRSVRRTGYELVGWAENGVLLEYFTPTVQRDVQLSAVWQPNQYNIIINIDTDHKETLKVMYGDFYALSEPVRKGYTFTGYRFSDTEIDLSGFYTYASDIQINAQFVPNKYSIVYVVDGETSDVQNVTYDKPFSLRDAPVKANHEFTGWYDKEIGGNRVSDGIYNNSANTIVYANWIKTKTIVLESDNEYTVDASVDKVYVYGNYDKTGNLVTNVNINVLRRDNNLTLFLKNAGFKAGNDKTAINCENSSYILTVINEGKSYVEGGNGSKGADGASSKMTEKNCDGKKGGAGQHAVNCGAIVFESSDRNSSLTLKSGNSGNGGNGGVEKKKGSHVWLNYKPDGGDSGDVLSALHCLKYSENGIKVSFELGELGNGGEKGSRQCWGGTKSGKNGGHGTISSDTVTYK